MRSDLARALAAAFLAGDWSPGRTWSRGVLPVLGRRPRWLAPLVAADARAVSPRRRATGPASWPPTSPRGRRRGRGPGRRVRPVVETRMLTNRWRLPDLDGVADLAAFLDIGESDLDWFADPRQLARLTSQAPLQHYRVSHRVGRQRRDPGPRGAEAAAQGDPATTAPRDGLPDPAARRGARLPPRRVGAVLRRAPCRPGRRRAAGPGGVLRQRERLPGLRDLAHCRLSRAGRARLAGLVTSILPLAAWRAVPAPADDGLLDAHWRLGRRLAAPHLPQGAPTSPAMANLAAFRLDVRLTALAASWGGRYTRYADDLAFSGRPRWGTGTSRLIDAVERIVVDEGFRLNARKTGVMPRAGRQSLGGLVVNERPRVSRQQVDELQAILHNCRTHGPSSQNRDDVPALEEHLRGRIAWVAQHDRLRGARLQAMHDEIDWSR